MKTIKQVRVLHEHVHFIPENEHLQEHTIYISKDYEIAIHLCLCGCKNIVAMPIGEGGWKLIEEENNKISFTPSVGNFQIECKSHYIITKNVANFV